MSCKEHVAQMMTSVPGTSRWLRTRRLRALAAAVLLASLAACANRPAQNDTPDTGELLRNSLPVAAAALAAGQFNVARRLYLSLSERFENAPEPFLGLGYIASQSGDSAAAETYFVQAAARATDAPALRAEALLGAGRTALVQGKVQAARRHFRDAQAPGRNTPSAAWIANGLAVTAALEADFGAAEIHYVEALRLSPGNPRIAANYIRMLVAAGRIDDAARTFTRHPESHWPDDEGATLSRLIEEARRQRRAQALAGTPAAAPDAAATEEFRSRGDTTTGQTELGAGSRVLDPDLPMRLYLSDALPGPANADTDLDTGVTLRNPSALMLHLDGPPAPSTPPAAVDDTPESGLSAPEPAATSSPSPPAPAGSAPPHPLPESRPPAAATTDHSPPTTLTLSLGQSRRLHLGRNATTVLVAAPEVADVRLLAPNVLYVIGKGIGRTSVAVLDDDERFEERVIAVVPDLEPLRTILAGEADLHGVRIRRLSRGIALTGEVASAASVDRALRLAAGVFPEDVSIENDLRIAAPRQVNLEVQIAEVHRSVTEDLGVSWEAFRVRGNQAFGFRIGRALTVDDGRLAPTSIDGHPSPSFYFGRATATTQIGAMIDALATAGLANVLARPNVTAVSGESASFFSGGERPIPAGFDRDTNTILYEYKKVGVVLDFVPTVVDTGRIVLTVRPEVSEPDTSQPLVIGPVSLPVINVRRAETTVEVGDGESIVIAGLFRNQSSTTEAGLPGLKDVPLLGLLFGTTSIRSNELELIVIVTARLVEPQATPDDTNAWAATLQSNGYHY